MRAMFPCSTGDVVRDRCSCCPCSGRSSIVPAVFWAWALFKALPFAFWFGLAALMLFLGAEPPH